MDLEQIFENNFDCYADTWQEENGKMIEGNVVLAMTKEKFIEVVKNLELNAVVQVCEHCHYPQDYYLGMTCEHCNRPFRMKKANDSFKSRSQS